MPKTLFWAASLSSWIYRDRKLGVQKTFRLRSKQMDGSLQSYLDELLYQRNLAVDCSNQIPLAAVNSMLVQEVAQDK